MASLISTLATYKKGGSVVIKNGGKLNALNLRQGTLIVSSGGEISTVSIAGNQHWVQDYSYYMNSYGRISICSGATATNVNIKNYYAVINVSDGGSVQSITCSGGSVYISSGGYISSTYITNGGLISVQKGASAGHISMYYSGRYDVAIDSGTYFNIKSTWTNGSTSSLSSTITAQNGSMDKIYVCVGQCIRVCSGAKINSVIQYGGAVISQPGAQITFVSNNLTAPTSWTYSDPMQPQSITGSLTVHSGTILNSFILYSCNATVFQSGSINAFSCFHSSNSIFISSGGFAKSTHLEAGDLTVANGGLILSTRVNYPGRLSVLSGGVIDGLVLSTYAYLTVYSGGSVLSLTSLPGAFVQNRGGYIDYG